MGYFKTDSLSSGGQTEQVVLLDETWSSITFTSDWSNTALFGVVTIYSSVDEGNHWSNSPVASISNSGTVTYTLQNSQFGCFNALKFVIPPASDPSNSVRVYFTGIS